MSKLHNDTKCLQKGFCDATVLINVIFRVLRAIRQGIISEGLHYLLNRFSQQIRNFNCRLGRLYAILAEWCFMDLFLHKSQNNKIKYLHFICTASLQKCRNSIKICCFIFNFFLFSHASFQVCCLLFWMYYPSSLSAV